MKNKNLNFIIAFIAIVTLIHFGCKREKLDSKKGNFIFSGMGSDGISSYIPTINDSSIIERQIRWIARGIPDLVQNDTKYNEGC
ncbi:MAG: hypothetical protein HUU47_03360 [Bacteroidetes bacterium]|nr:hypothetical protein [Bacteroidota bacterium]